MPLPEGFRVESARKVEIRLKAKKEREEEQRKKEDGEAHKKYEKFLAHSEETQQLYLVRLIKQLPGGTLNEDTLKLFLGKAFDKIWDLRVEIGKLKDQLGITEEIKKDIKALEVKINAKEINTLIENLEETPG